MSPVHHKFMRFAMAAVTIAWCVPSSAHHGPSYYDFDQAITLKGVLIDVQSTNPHAFLKLETRGENGERVEWFIATASSSFLTRRGIFPEALVTGETIEVVASPARDAPRNEVWAQAIRKEDGTVLEMPRPSDPAAEAELKQRMSELLESQR
jgi:hypothetical protein